MSLLTQAIIFAVMLATGLALGLWFDLFRFINCRGRWAPFLDLLLWAAATCAVFVVLMNVNYLELRFYVFLSLTLGLLLYFKLFSRHVLHLYRFLFTFILRVAKFLRRLLVPPLGVAAWLVDGPVELAMALAARAAAALFPDPKQDNLPPV
ncbi:MAG: hypothetical protein GX090_06845 [Firmicutes bacterium]|nr:hypothetical protein [Bacillota bacterium]HOB35606.1 spore cortex biosynthesis protein YabQ [Bacillota bacterium]HPZ91310.1 spore cortex biosynthesis protein YabQ [Bacillota bacterium]HQE02424.1 spore cortex biosynthesis protein YabQ [Bacillota bacterium]